MILAGAKIDEHFVVDISMGLHSDDEPELGQQPIIASLTLGEERTFVFRHKYDKQLKPVRVALGAGHLLIMKGDTQRNWQHGIFKESKRCGSRINLTFRKIYRLASSSGPSS